MRKKLVCLVVSVAFLISIGFKDIIYADSYVSGTTTASLNIRSGPSTNYSILGVFFKGSTVQIVGKQGDWLKVIYKNSYAYILNNYVNSVYSKVSSEGVVSNCWYLSVRSGPDKSYSVKGTLEKGDKTYIIEGKNGWYKIVYKGDVGYVSEKYISISNNNNNSTNDSNDNSNNYSSSQKGIVTASALNVRKNMTTQSSSLGLLYKNDTVRIVDDIGDWYKILYKNNYAFVSKNYVILGGTQTVTNLNNFLFVGDSFTYRLKTTIEANTTGAYVNAKSGVYPSYWINNFHKMPDSSNVKGVVLLIGINGISRESNYTDTKKLIDLLSSKYSGKTVYVQRVFPVGKGYWDYSEASIANYNKNRIDTFNAKIKSYCSIKSNVKFIDTTSGFIDANGFLINCEQDGLHILGKYNKQFFDNIQTAVINAK